MQVFKYEIAFVTRDDVTPEQASELINDAMESLEGTTDYQYRINLIERKSVAHPDIGWEKVSLKVWKDQNEILKQWETRAV